MRSDEKSPTCEENGAGLHMTEVSGIMSRPFTVTQRRSYCEIHRINMSLSFSYLCLSVSLTRLQPVFRLLLYELNDHLLKKGELFHVHLLHLEVHLLPMQVHLLHMQVHLLHMQVHLQVHLLPMQVDLLRGSQHFSEF
jgi:hypothetical protein